ncbi:MAG TPA: hypothetical protein VKD66_21985 [Streptosporangiaceae bacterium]|nr:hypothetical protein [Streptosporangiaceae bacterium]
MPTASSPCHTMFAGHAGTAIAERLGTPAVTFPGGHDGFLGGEFGRTAGPDAFAATLRDVLEAGRGRALPETRSREHSSAG